MILLCFKFSEILVRAESALCALCLSFRTHLDPYFARSLHSLVLHIVVSFHLLDRHYLAILWWSPPPF